jgi:uncharacterized RDD family membrane protein YckC
VCPSAISGRRCTCCAGAEPYNPLRVLQTDELVPAGLGRRLAAAAIDTALLVVLALLVASVVLASDSVLEVAGVLPNVPGGRLLLAALVLAMIASWLYSTLLHISPWQATVGKRLLGLTVTDRRGRRISFLRATARHVASVTVYLTLFAGFVVVLVPGSRQALHDLIAGMLVVRRRPALAAVRPEPVVALPDRPRPAVTISPDGRWWWDGQRWQPTNARVFVPMAQVPARPWPGGTEKCSRSKG